MSPEELEHHKVIDWVTIPAENDRIAVVTGVLVDEEGDVGDLLRVLKWKPRAKEWDERPDWLGREEVVSIEVGRRDPVFDKAQSEWSRRQLRAIYHGGWTNGEESKDED